MPYPATVFNVMIASPGDVQVERNIIREVIHEWNAVHASTRGIVLLPLGWETHSTPIMGDRPQEIINSQVLKNSDLLIAVFWTRIGSPTGQAISGTVEEIEQHNQAGKPAMLYFSSAPVRLDSVDEKQYKALMAFKDECKKRGLIETYDSPADFQDKVRRQVSKTLNTHSFFQPFSQAKGDIKDTNASASSFLPSLSKEASELLIQASQDQTGHILMIEGDSGLAVQTNNKEFVETGNPRSEAMWRTAIKELRKHDLIERFDNGRQEFARIFSLTHRGYKAAELLKP